MNGGKRSAGYTIVEVMIVLAVSGLMFVTAANFINGKQQKSAFNSGVNEMASRVQDVIGQVNDGQYSDVAFGCDVISNSVVISGTRSQGKNSQCIFLGKYIYFFQNDDQTKYQVISLAGKRLDSATGKPVIDLSNASPTPIRSADGVINLNSDQMTSQSLNVLKITLIPSEFIAGGSDSGGGGGDGGGSCGGVGVPCGGGETVSAADASGFGFVQDLGVLREDGEYKSGSKGSVKLVYASALDKGEADVSSIPSPGLTGASSVEVCLTDGTRYATIVVGSNGNQLSVDRQFGETDTCKEA